LGRAPDRHEERLGRIGPVETTVSREELIDLCDAAGEGAGVEYDLEVQDRANGRGVTGVDLRIVGPAPE
jgi:hypothetical protein